LIHSKVDRGKHGYTGSMVIIYAYFYFSKKKESELKMTQMRMPER
jgi:hypothetical protein